MSLNYSDIEGILRTEDFSKLKNQVENIFFDVKEQPYEFKTDEDKRELCKDVSEFANTNGGFIIYGISEIKEPNKPHRRVDEVKGVDTGKINKQTYVQHLEKFLYPKIDSLGMIFSKLDGKDIFYIQIPPGLSGMPYLVAGNADYFALKKRTDEFASTSDVREIHELLTQGLKYQDKLKFMDGKLDVLLERSSPGQPTVDSSDIKELKKRL